MGDWVYSVDNGAIVAVPLSRVGRTRAVGHHVERVVLATGAVLEISARIRSPTAAPSRTYPLAARSAASMW